MIQQFSLTVIGNRKKTAFRHHYYSLDSLVGYRDTDTGDMGQKTRFTFKTFSNVQRARRLPLCICSQRKFPLYAKLTLPDSMNF